MAQHREKSTILRTFGFRVQGLGLRVYSGPGNPETLQSQPEAGLGSLRCPAGARRANSGQDALSPRAPIT